MAKKKLSTNPIDQEIRRLTLRIARVKKLIDREVEACRKATETMRVSLARSEAVLKALRAGRHSN